MLSVAPKYFQRYSRLGGNRVQSYCIFMNYATEISIYFTEKRSFLCKTC